MNILQRLDARETLCVTLNRSEAIDPARILKRIVYHHPLYTPEAVAARSVSGFAPTSTIRAAPCSSKWVKSAILRPYEAARAST